MAHLSPRSSGDLLFEVDGGIGRVTFNRPQARNALTFEMYEGLAEICRAAGEGGLKALIVTGAGDKAFAAGTDIALFRDFHGAEDGLAYERKMEAVLSDVEACAVPTIAAVSGACTGGGAVIAAACDIRLATQNLQFGVPIARTLGNCLSAANLDRLSALIGEGRAREILLTARLIGADEALAIGLVSQVVVTADEMMEHAQELARRMAGFAPLTLRYTKEAFRRLDQARRRVADDDLIAASYSSADFREGLEAFLAKRPPQWKGR